MMQFTKQTVLTIAGLAMASIAAPLHASDWTAPVEVLHEHRPCVSYRARLDGEFLVVQAKIEPGWHTFVMDNKQRSAEKLAGRQSLGVDGPTEIALSGGLEAAGPWHQSAPKDFSKPELRWFSWGYEQQAQFVAKVRRSGAGPAQIGIRGQACTETTCKNIDVTISLPLSAATGTASAVDWKTLVPVRATE
jgi:DsbC/DsbD-like thiol-disulfide interchange protein